MTLQIIITRTKTEICTIEVPYLHQAKPVIETLTNDDFSEIDEGYTLEVFNAETNEDITGFIQPNCRLLG